MLSELYLIIHRQGERQVAAQIERRRQREERIVRGPARRSPRRPGRTARDRPGR